MRKRKLIINALLLGFAFVISNQSITAKAAVGYNSPLEISEALIKSGRTMDNIVDNSSEWRYGRITVNGKNHKTLTLAQKYCFNRVTGQAAQRYDDDDKGNIVFNGKNGLANNTQYKIDRSKVGKGYHEYSFSVPTGTQIPIGYWRNDGLHMAVNNEEFDAATVPFGEGGYYDTTKWGTWANYYGVDYHATSEEEKIPFVAPNEPRTKCFDLQANRHYRDSTGWIGYCAICGKEMVGLHYAPYQAMKDLSVVSANAGYVFTCPTCGGLEVTYGYFHECVAISANRYYVVYDDGTDDPNVTGNTPTSTFYYNFADEYEGNEVKSQDRFIAKNGFVRDGYTFIGWSTTKDGTVDYQPYDDIKLFQDPTTNNKTTTLYAVWKPNHSYFEVDANANSYAGGARYLGETNYYREDTYHVLNNSNPADPAAPSFTKSTYQIDTSKITLPKGYTVSFVSIGTTPSPITAKTYFVGYDFKKNNANGSFNISSGVYTYGPENRGKDNPDIVVLQYTQDTIILPGTSANNKSFIGWYDGPGDNSNYVGTAGDEYYPEKNTILYAKFSQLKIDVKSVYFRKQGEYPDSATEFNNIALDRLNNADNGSYNKFKASDNILGVRNGTGAVNMKIGTFTSTRNEYVYKTYYRVKGTTTWTEINVIDGTSNVPTANQLNKTFGYTGYEQTYTVESTGFYNLSAIGAQGGDFNGNAGGKGGKTEATYYLKKGDILHIYVGGKGDKNGTGGYNGGGAGDGTNGAGGGGATTVVLERNGTKTTLMIAGGGGGATKQDIGGDAVN